MRALLIILAGLATEASGATLSASLDARSITEGKHAVLTLR